MATTSSIRCYDYVNRTFAEVKNRLLENPNRIFSKATQVASSRANAVGADLRINVAGIEIGKEIEIKVLNQEISDSPRDQHIELTLEWRATEMAGLFPVMNGTLSAYPITLTETQLDFQGVYQPPLGIMGKAIDAIVGHRIAEASVHSFVSEIAAYLRAN